MKLFSYHAIAGLLLLACAGFANGTTYETNAWTQAFSQGPSSNFEDKLTVDSLGNEYVISASVTTQGANGYDLVRLDPAGNVTLKVHINIGTPQVQHVFVKTAPSGGALPNIYVAAYLVGPTYSQTYAAKFDSTGANTWYKLLGSAQDSNTPIGFDVDQTGTTYLANRTSKSLDLLQISSAGTVKDVQAQNGFSFIGYHVARGWVTVPQSLGSVAGWTLIDQNTGQVTASQGVGASPFQVFFNVFPQKDGTFLVAEEVTPTGPAQMPLYVLYRFDGYGNSMWASLIGQGYVNYVTVGPDTTFAAVSVPTGNQLHPEAVTIQPFSSQTGKAGFGMALGTNVSAYFLQADVDGGLCYIKDDPAATPHLNIAKLSSNLSEVNVTPFTVASPDLQTFADVNGVLYLTISAPTVPANSTSSTFVQKFVPGVTLSGLAPSATTVKSGASITMKVQLNAPAPAGGLMVHLTSDSAKLLFANSTQSLSLAIPAGSIYAVVTLHATTVTANTTANITALQGVVTRKQAFLVTP